MSATPSPENAQSSAPADLNELHVLGQALQFVARQNPDASYGDGLRLALEQVCQKLRPNRSAELLDILRPHLRRLG